MTNLEKAGHATLSERLSKLTADEVTANAHADDPIAIGGRTYPREDVAEILGGKLDALPSRKAVPRLPDVTFRGARGITMGRYNQQKNALESGRCVRFRCALAPFGRARAIERWECQGRQSACAEAPADAWRLSVPKAKPPLVFTQKSPKTLQNRSIRHLSS
ncbi:MAG TPA: hypothetical protein VMV69_07255, partial [Pirellulales bacterium]|nr:hypothetical protein [Pirellulales bacterium]